MIQELIQKYPRLFPKDEQGNATDPVCWSGAPEGWRQLIDGLCKSLDDYLESKNLPFEIAQIKEKFGGLRFYADGGDEETRKMISIAEEASYSICQNTGEKGEARRNKTGWVATLSDSEAERLGFPRRQT